MSFIPNLSNLIYINSLSMTWAGNESGMEIGDVGTEMAWLLNM